VLDEEEANAPEKFGGGGEAATELEKDDRLEGGFIADRPASEGVPGFEAVGVSGWPPGPSLEVETPSKE
jgi:hypothetical protein